MQKTVMILGVGGMFPDCLIYGKPDEPAKQKVIVKLLDQHTFAANRVKYLQQQGTKQLLRRNRWSACLKGIIHEIPARIP